MYILELNLETQLIKNPGIHPLNPPPSAIGVHLKQYLITVMRMHVSLPKFKGSEEGAYKREPIKLLDSRPGSLPEKGRASQERVWMGDME